MGDHTETVEVIYNPEIISYLELLDVFFSSHSPFSQSYSRQYQSVVLYTTPEQKRLAEVAKDKLEAKRGKKVYTAVAPAEGFYLAEDYHQKYYLRKRPDVLKELGKIFKDVPENEMVITASVASLINGFLGKYLDVATLKVRMKDFEIEPDGRERLIDLLLR